MTDIWTSEPKLTRKLHHMCPGCHGSSKCYRLIVWLLLLLKVRWGRMRGEVRRGARDEWRHSLLWAQSSACCWGTDQCICVCHYLQNLVSEISPWPSQCLPLHDTPPNSDCLSLGSIYRSPPPLQNLFRTSHPIFVTRKVTCCSVLCNS
jgi:hypothetical protein